MAPTRERSFSWSKGFTAASAILSVTVIVLGLLVLIGWALDIQRLKRGLPSLPTTMKVNTAVLFCAVGIGLWLQRSTAVRTGRVKQAAGWFVVIAAALSLSQWFFAIDLGIDQLLIRDDDDSSRYPGRMSPATSMTLLLLGLALVVRRGHRRSVIRRSAGMLAFVSALVAVLGYVYGARSLYAVGQQTSIALHTAVGLFLAACALLLARPDEGLAGLLTDDSQAGRLMRTLLPAIGLVPLAIGWFLLIGVDRGFYDIHVGVALMSLAIFLALTRVGSIIATSLRRSEIERARADERLRDLNRTLEARVIERTAEVELARNRLDRIISMAADAIISIDQDQRIMIFNRGAEVIFGWTQHEVLGKPLDVLLPERLRTVHSEHVASFAKGPVTARRMAERREVFGIRKNGEAFPAEAAISKQTTPSGLQFTVILRDITERRQLEEEQARAHAERAMLLKEIHHRVKNNLQMISSLFYVQEQRTDNEIVRKLLDESRSRVYSIALIHDKLYKTERLASVELGDYMRDLTASLTDAFGLPHIHLRIDAEPVFLDIDRAVPCALIVNELIANSLKHAFPDGRQGEIRIGVKASGSEIEIEVRDTGIGFPTDLDFTKVTSLGLQLVVMLTNQLHGRVELQRRDGTTFRICFPAMDVGARSGMATHAH